MKVGHMIGKIKDFWRGPISFPKAASVVAVHLNAVTSWRHNCYTVRRNAVPSLYMPTLNFVFRPVQEQTKTCIFSLCMWHVADLLWLTTFSKKHTLSLIQTNFSLYRTIWYAMRKIRTTFSYALLPTSNCKKFRAKAVYTNKIKIATALLSWEYKMDAHGSASFRTIHNVSLSIA
jgi:hypothetical protein